MLRLEASAGTYTPLVRVMMSALSGYNNFFFFRGGGGEGGGGEGGSREDMDGWESSPYIVISSHLGSLQVLREE